ncbi:MAG: hypothetical protein SCJ97_00405 [Bacillota bacterium]|nr:hypothetical protein [Bacillota bacterium]
MFKKISILGLLVFILIAGSFINGCSQVETDSDQLSIIEGEGIYTGQIDNQSVEIEIDGQPRVFVLGQGVNTSSISENTPVRFTFTEEEIRPVLLSIEPLAAQLEAEGIYTGQIDSHSVEIELDNEFVAFALGEGVSVDHIPDGSRVSFIYIETGDRPVLLFIEELESLAAGEESELIGEGIFIGQIDANSVEILINRVFIIGESVNLDDVDDGSLVVYTYTEDGPRAVLDSIEVVEEPVEGEVLHGTYIGQIDGQSVEIEYYRAFALGEGVAAGDIEDGSEVVFVYRESQHRPILISITKK